MAWNAVLVTAPDERYGRSYMEHVVALAPPRTTTRRSPPTSAPPPACCATRRRNPPGLITLGKPDMRALDAAQAIVEFARARVSAI